jgi:hypothetical protein
MEINPITDPQVGEKWCLHWNGFSHVPHWANGEPVIVEEITKRGIYVVHHVSDNKLIFRVRREHLRKTTALEVKLFGQD